MREDKTRKGTFSHASLGVSPRYVMPARRRWVMLAGGGLAALAASLLATDVFFGTGRSVSEGPLSSNHAILGADCAACHEGFRSVTAEKCSTCHEKLGDELGVYTYASHYLYRSDDFRRLEATASEEPCQACHGEHRGREASITQVPDARCLVCHDRVGFASGHPEFEFVAAEIPDPSGLRFPHARHVREVMQRQGLLDVEKACLTCHRPQPDGKLFQPIDFDRQCDACHLTAGTATPRLPIRRDDRVGVETLAAIRQRGGPGSEWSLFMNPDELREVGGFVSKVRLHHRDPWILENLRGLRRQLYEDAGLADLLRTTPQAPAHEIRSLYGEAVERLEQYAVGLRSRREPEVQQELARVTELLEGVRRRLEDPYTALDESELVLAVGVRRPGLGDEEVAAIEEVVRELTTPCRTCHVVERATIGRVQKAQQTLRRAEFNHRAHILQARCLDCHATIPIAESLEPGAPLPDAAVDHAAIQNLPTIATCQRCHTPQLGTARCVTCHAFHPDPGRRSHLLLYIDRASSTVAGGQAAGGSGGGGLR